MHVSPVAHLWVAEHDCPAVLGAACATHLPDEHAFPVSQSVLNEHVAEQVFLAAAVAVACCSLHILLVHCKAEVHTAPLLGRAGVPVLPLVPVVNVPEEPVPGCSLKPPKSIAFPVSKLRLVPKILVPEPDAAAAHVPTLNEPVNTMLAQLLLLQSEFSLHTPPFACNGAHMPSLSLAIMHAFPVPHCEFNVHDAQTLLGLQYPEVQSAFEAHESVPVESVPAGVHAALHLARQADWHVPTESASVPALLDTPAPVPAAPPVAAAGLAQTLLVHVRPVAQGWVVEHDCPAVLGEAGVTHFPEVHAFPVSQSLANEHVVLHTLLADVVALPQILLVHSGAVVHETPAAFPFVAINVLVDAVLGDNFKLEIGIVAFPVREDNTPGLLAAGFVAHLHMQFPFGQSFCVLHDPATL